MGQEHSTSKRGLTAIATVSGMLKAAIIKSQLESAGIPAMLDYESAGILFGITVDGLKLGQVRIWVEKEYAEQALEILNTPPEPGWEEEATSPSETA